MAKIVYYGGVFLGLLSGQASAGVTGGACSGIGFQAPYSSEPSFRVKPASAPAPVIAETRSTVLSQSSLEDQAQAVVLSSTNDAESLAREDLYIDLGGETGHDDL